ncbi:MAG: MFS transporter [Chromatiales bacterium]|nr:MFS transporter [Chromatiales bacterium]
MTAYSRGRVLLIMSALLLASLMASLDSSFLPLAFPDMIDDLDSSTSEIVWVALGYLVAATGPMLLAARMADAWGHVRLFQVGTVIYSLAMIACTFAPDVPVLIGLRLVQGLGMALFLPTTFAIATRIYGPEKRGRALGLLQAANAAGFILGPIFAGWLLDAYDWRATFASRIPFAILTIVLALLALDYRQPMAVAGASRRFDIPGALYLTGALFGVLFGCNRLPVEDNHLDPLVWLVFAAGFVFFWLFMRRERTCAEPLIDLGLFSNSAAFSRACVAFAAMFASLPLTLFVLPIVLINGLEMRAWDVGFIMAVSALCTTVMSPWAGRAADRWNAEWLASAGAIVRGAGYLLLLFVTINTEAAGLYLPLIVIGIGTGLFFSPNNALLLANAPPERAGMVSGLFGTIRQAGYAFGFALIASLFAATQDYYETNWTHTGFGHLTPDAADQLTAIFDGGGIWSPEMLVFILRVAAVVCTAILLLALINSLPRLKITARRQMGALAASAGAAVLGVYALLVLVPGGVVVDESVAASIEAAAPPPVAAFGMPARLALAGEEAPVASGTAGPFADYCASCHGADGRGLPGLGVNLVESSFVRGASPADLEGFLRKGRMPGEPGNVTGRPMPAFEWLGDEMLEELVRELENWSG